MKHPAYHLRPNKAVDRFAFIEAIRYLEKLYKLNEYIYYGMGGPYLDEYRLLYEYFPVIKMVSIEKNAETYKRQRFHLPCGHLKLINIDTKSFITGYEPKNKKSIFWLDYTYLKYGCFEDFTALLPKLTPMSMIKITLEADPSKYFDKDEEFRQQFEKVLPKSSAGAPSTNFGFAYLLQEMLQIATEKTLPGTSPNMIQPVSSFYYSDGTPMFTFTGIVCLRSDRNKVRNAYRYWKFANLNWGIPKEISVPILSTKERLMLEKCLPCLKYPGKRLHKVLGYLIDDSKSITLKKLEQYADFHRYYPYFLRGIP